MAAVYNMPSSANKVPLGGAEMQAIATEFMLSHPLNHLVMRTGFTAVKVIALALADIYAVYHLLELRYVDALGNSTIGSNSAGLISLSCVTVVAYLLAGFCWDYGRWGKAAAGLAYGTVLALLFTTLGPVEAPHLREFWAASFSSTSFGATDGEMPAWALALALLVIAVAYTGFGILLVFSERALLKWIGLWRDRAEARQVLRKVAETAKKSDQAAEIADLLNLVNEHKGQYLEEIGGKGLEAYQTTLQQEIASLEATLNSRLASKATKARAEKRLAAAQACLASVRNLF